LATGWQGVDYQLETVWNNGTWKSTLYQFSPTGANRTLEDIDRMDLVTNIKLLSKIGIVPIMKRHLFEEAGKPYFGLPVRHTYYRHI
jgi:hypothetical protein